MHGGDSYSCRLRLWDKLFDLAEKVPAFFFLLLDWKVRGSSNTILKAEFEAIRTPLIAPRLIVQGCYRIEVAIHAQQGHAPPIYLTLEATTGLH